MQQSHDEHANCDGLVGACMESENGHDVENSDEEEGSLNDKPEQVGLLSVFTY